MRVFVLDNYDSFTYNLVHYCRSEGAEVRVVTNDASDPEEASGYDRVIISPGPGLPTDSGQLMSFLGAIDSRVPILGVCLGLQAIVEHFGGRLIHLPRVMHGISSQCDIIRPDLLFPFAEPSFEAGHYHSWAAQSDMMPECLEVTAVSSENLVMALRHRRLPIRGVQFHPESVLTPRGREMLSAWLIRANEPSGPGFQQC